MLVITSWSNAKFSLDQLEPDTSTTKAPKIVNPNQYIKPKSNSGTYTIIVYMAADNDLFPFAGRNIKQMQNIGSNEHIKLLIHFDMHRPGQKKVTKRLVIEKNKVLQVEPDMSMDSGDMNTLIDCFKWAVEKFPSDNYILILWNHGTGIIEPVLKRAINPSELFNYNQATKLIELNRNIGFLDYINNLGSTMEKSRGICFDDSTGNYLTNQKLKSALQTICKTYLKGNKIAILACDACLMSMIEVASPLQNYVEYFVGSQEVELGTGYNYSTVLTPFATTSLDKTSFACHIVDAYTDTYNKITNDYTQSALDLSQITPLENNVTEISKTLINGLLNQKNKSVKEAIKLSKHKSFCTHFDEPTYIDLGHFFSNMLKNLPKCSLNSTNETNDFKNKLGQLLKDGIQLITNLVVANTVGSNLKNAQGISIYFPESNIHSSYSQSDFATNTNWLQFLITYQRS